MLRSALGNLFTLAVFMAVGVILDHFLAASVAELWGAPLRPILEALK